MIEFSQVDEPKVEEEPRQILLKDCSVGELVLLADGDKALVCDGMAGVLPDCVQYSKCLIYFGHADEPRVAGVSIKDAMLGNGSARIIERLGKIAEIKYDPSLLSE